MINPIRKIENKLDLPFSENSEPVRILWSRDGNFDKNSMFQPNHIVPIVRPYKRPRPEWSDACVESTNMNTKVKQAKIQSFFSPYSKKQNKADDSSLDVKDALTSIQNIKLPPTTTAISKNTEALSTKENSKKHKSTNRQKHEKQKSKTSEALPQKQNSDNVIKHQKEQKRQFVEDWKVNRPWLSYNVLYNKMSCHYCEKFKNKISDPKVKGLNAGNFIDGTNNFRKSTISDHETSQAHLKAECLWKASDMSPEAIRQSSAGKGGLKRRKGAGFKYCSGMPTLFVNKTGHLVIIGGCVIWIELRDLILAAPI